MGSKQDHRSGPVHVTDIDLGGEPLVIVSFPVPASEALSSLSEAEREVARLVVQGCSNKAIATKRGTSVRTVANQMASLFRKLGVGSRVELAAALAVAPTDGGLS